MAPLSAPRYTTQDGDTAVNDRTSYPIADNVKIYEGGVVVLSGGYAAPGATGLGLIVVGIAETHRAIPTNPGAIPQQLGAYDNTGAGHAAAAFNVDVKPGVFKLDNSGGADAIAQANVGQMAFLVDDHTVALTDGNGTRSAAGKIMGVDSDGVWVSLGLQDGEDGSIPYPRQVIVLPVPALAGIADAQVVARYTNRFAGAIRVKAVDVLVTTPVTTAAKATTLTTKNDGNALTGGVVGLTSANCTPTGAIVAGSAITAGNVIPSGKDLTIVASGTTAFAEGAVAIVITLG